MDIRFSGFGGQGIIKSGMLIGKAVSLYDNKFATLTQSFGPEARGGACSAQVVIDDNAVLYPYIVTPKILVSMSQEAYEKFIAEPLKGSIILTDTEEYVHEDTEILEGVHHLTDQTNTYNSSKQDIIRTSAERKIMENAMQQFEIECCKAF